MIAATNIDIESAIKEGNFREDLFYRISVILIDMPPLRDREFDIKLLANTFLERYKAMYRKKVKGFSRSAMDAIDRYSWPGNVRELENKLQKALITTDSNMIEPHDLGLDECLENENGTDTKRNRYSGVSLKEARKRLEMDLVESAVRSHKGNIKRASEELGVSRPTLYDLIDKYKLSVKDNPK